MTFSILTYDLETGVLAGGAATGSLCVGGWVLRGDIESGLVASQGTAPSTFWRDDVIRRMYRGETAEAAVAAVTGGDTGRGHRQLAALDRQGRSAAFTGTGSVAHAGHFCAKQLVVAGNMLTGPEVLEVLRDSALADAKDPAERILHALRAAEKAGGDQRGLQSAALMVLSPDRPPLDLRIDHDADPIAALARLSALAHASPYYDWLGDVPVLMNKTRAPAKIPTQ